MWSAAPRPASWRWWRMAKPGERWLYSTGADVLGVLIARAAAMPFERFLREGIFEPLGMTDTAFHVPAEKLDRLPVEYGTDQTTGATVICDEPAPVVTSAVIPQRRMSPEPTALDADFATCAAHFAQ